MLLRPYSLSLFMYNDILQIEKSTLYAAQHLQMNEEYEGMQNSFTGVSYYALDWKQAQRSISVVRATSTMHPAASKRIAVRWSFLSTLLLMWQEGNFLGSVATKFH